MYRLFICVSILLACWSIQSVSASTNASTCDPLDPSTAYVFHKSYDPESDITVALLSFKQCDGTPDRIAIAYDGKLSDMLFDQVDLYTLPSNGQYGDFDSESGKHKFWLFQPDQKIELSNSQFIQYEDLSHVQLYLAQADDGLRFELKIDSTDLTLLQNGAAYIASEYNIAAQYINNRWYYYPYGTQPAGTDIPLTVYLPLVGK